MKDPGSKTALLNILCNYIKKNNYEVFVSVSFYENKPYTLCVVDKKQGFIPKNN